MATSNIFKRKSRQEIKEHVLHTDPLRDYRAQRTGFFGELFVQQLPPWRIHTGRMMLSSDSMVGFSLNIRNAALMPAEVVVECKNEVIKKWVEDQWKTLWNQHRSKLVSAKKFGCAPLQVLPKEKHGLVCVDTVKDFAPEDCRALEISSRVVGIRVQGKAIYSPQALWLNFNAEYGGAYGVGCLRRSYPAWYEKWMDHGAKKLLQLRMIKDAYIGDIFWYPPNMLVELPTGEKISWKNMLREISENRLSGSALTLPRLLDNQGKELTGYTPPQDVSGGSHIFEWNDMCDKGILTGADVPLEVVEASSSGSGYSGRSVPFLVLLSTVNQEFAEIVQAVDAQIIRPYAWLNWGGDPDYQILPRSLVESFTEDTSGSPMGGGALGGQPSTAPAPQVIPASPGGVQQGGVQFGEVEFNKEDNPLHAPPGGVTIHGVRYEGGEFIPKEVINELSPKEKQTLRAGTIARHIKDRPELGEGHPEAKEEVHDKYGPVLETENWEDGTVVKFVASPFKKLDRRTEYPKGSDIKSAKEKTVELDSLYRTQDRVTVNGMEKEANNSMGLPLVVRSNGIDYVQDGHHRLSRQKFDGKTKAKVRYIDLDKKSSQHSESEPAKFSCAMFDFTGDLAFEIIQLSARIPSADLQPTDYGDASDTGREMQPHVTIKYGIHTDDTNEVRAVVQGLSPVAIQLGKTSHFDGAEYDVVKIEVKSEGLHALNKKVCEGLECTDTFPDYKPHVTLAYVKKGLGDFYARKLNDLQGRVAVFDWFVFSNKERVRSTIPLTGDAQFKEGGIPSNGETFQFDEGKHLVTIELLRALIKRGMDAKALMADRIKALATTTIPPESLAQLVEKELRNLRPILSSQLALANYASQLVGMAEVVAALPKVSLPPPTPPVDTATLFPDVPPPETVYPVLEDALTTLKASPLGVGATYRETAELVKQGAFAITGEITEKAVGEVRDILHETLNEGEGVKEFIEKVTSRLEDGGPLSDAHVENIFRTNSMSQLSSGKLRALQNPIVADNFPYVAYYATRDARVRENHWALEKLGLDGTNIYRIDDPTFLKFRPPWDYQCRCSFVPQTVEQAARKGVKEAVEWMERAVAMATEKGGTFYEYLNNTAPTTPQHVTPPDFEPSPEFERNYGQAS